MTMTIPILLRTFLAVTALLSIVVLPAAPDAVPPAEHTLEPAPGGSAAIARQPAPDRVAAPATGDPERPTDDASDDPEDASDDPADPPTRRPTTGSLRDGAAADPEPGAGPGGGGDQDTERGRSERDPGTGRPGTDPSEHLLGELDPDEDVPPYQPPAGGLRASDGHRSPPPSSPGPAGPNDMKAGPGCSVQCITSGVAYARGVGARLVVETDTPAKHWIIVWNEDTGYHAYRHSSQPGTTYGQLFDDLEPGTTYLAMAAAQDAAGYTSHAYGSFTTLRREAEVLYHLNWSVTQTPYDDRFHFHYRVDHVWRDHLSTPAWPHPAPPPNLPQWVKVSDADRYLDLAVQVVAEGPKHSGFGKGGCPVEWTDTPFGPFTQGAGTGEHGCVPYAWATAMSSCLVGVDLDARPADATSWTAHTLYPSISTADGCHEKPPLTFVVTATVEVRYVP